MSRRSLVTGVLLFLAGLAGFAVGRGQELAPPQPQLNSLEERAAYSIGLDLGRRLAAESGTLKADLIAKGFMDGLKKSKPLLTDEEIKTTMTTYAKQMQAAAEAKLKPLAEKNLKEGQEFLAANKAKKDVVTTESGLQYQVIKSGEGASPKKTDVVRVHYHGTLLDGKVFDSSVKRNEPAEFPVGEVIPGWTEALQKMKVGDKWKLFIPPDLAYRDRGTPGGPIGPNAVLIFEVELLGIVK